MQKILIGIPSSGSCIDEFAMALDSCVEYTASLPNTKVDRIRQIGAYIDWNREDIAEFAVKNNYDYLMFFDTDMDFPEDIIEKFIKHDVDCVTTNYTNYKADPMRFTAVDFLGKHIHTTEETEGLDPVQAAPTGTMLIKVPIFKKLQKQWFGTMKPQGLTEDYWFCVRCKEAGVNIFIDHTMTKQVGHYGKKKYTWQDVPKK